MLPSGLQKIGSLTVYAFDASQLGIWGRPLSPSHFIPTSPDEVIGLSGALAAVDGTQFDNCPGQNLPSDNLSAYAQSQCGYPSFLCYDAARGVSAPPAPGPYSGSGVTISVTNGQAVALAGPVMAPGARVAVQLFPTLLRNGQNVASEGGTNANTEWRAGLAIITPKQLAFVVGVGSMNAFAEAIRGLGATDAGYTDGSYSAALATPTIIHAPTPHRRVPTWLVAMPAAGSGSAAAKGVLIGSLVTLGALAIGVAISER